ncbi:hypothetical protein ACGF12_06945 [Kitasatospora sp. NPDC048296]|uniref:hypothetical protein n=1 Tax=Kitasatospora sp. NPDC048296 TaxID=3364048 RepID=UPI003720C473
MQSVTFAAWREDGAGRRYVTLAELLVRLGSFGLDLQWRARIYEAPSCAKFARIEEACVDAPIGTLDLLAMVAPDLQTVDGDFAGYADGELAVVLREFDSTSWDFWTADAGAMREILRHYPDAAPTSEDLLQELPWGTGLMR